MGAAAASSSARKLSPLLLSLLLSLSAASCATRQADDVWHRWLLDADADYDYGHYARAQSIYARLADTAPDPSLRRYIDFKLALITAAEGDPDAATTRLRALADDPHPDGDPWSSQALYAIAGLQADRGDEDAARATTLTVIRRFPDDAITLRALQDLLRAHRRRGDIAAAQATLAGLFADLSETTLGDNLLFELARIELDDLKRPAQAEDLLTRHIQSFPFSPLRDDVTMRLAHLLRDQGRPLEALTHLEWLAAQHDAAWSFGSYDSTLRDDAMLLRAQLFLAVGAPESAFDEYARLLSAFPDYLGGATIARDQLDLLRAPLADRPRYIAALTAYPDAYPDSVHLPDLRCRLLYALADAPLPDIPALARRHRPPSDLPPCDPHTPDDTSNPTPQPAPSLTP
jgi:tetratricopeptide (TPR) repeat protein